MPDQSEPQVERSTPGEPLPSRRTGGPAGPRAAGDVVPDLDARDRATHSRRKQAGPGRPGRGRTDQRAEPVPPQAPLPDVPPSEPTG